MKKWQYITKNGDQGPVSPSELRDLYEAGTIGWETQIWAEGMASWEPLSYHRNLVKKHLSPPNPSESQSNVKSARVDSERSRFQPKPGLKKNQAPAGEKNSPGQGSNPVVGSLRGWVVSCTVLAILGMLLYPPFQITYLGTIDNMGYGFLFSPPAVRGITASIAVQILLIQMLVVLIVAGASWYFSGYIPQKTGGELTSSAGRRMVKYLKSAGLFLLAGIASLVIFGVLMVGLSAVVLHFTNQGMLEAVLFFDSYLKLNALAFFSVWAWLAGRFLSKDGPKRWGRIGFYIYLGVPIISYLFSFFVASNS
jgi:hypothetical protein